LVSREQPCGALPGHSAQLDIVAMIFLDEGLDRLCRAVLIGIQSLDIDLRLSIELLIMEIGRHFVVQASGKESAVR
jgi:hypothetical protein